MSDIRFNQWLHNSGTGGVSQVDGGHVGIGTTNPEIAVHSGNNKILNVGIVTASTYYGDGSNLTGLVGGATGLDLNDNIKIRLGNSQDFQLYHDGNNSLIQDSGTGHVQVRSGTFTIGNATLSKTSAVFNSGAGQQLNFNNVQKFVTTNTGAIVTGIVTATSRVSLGNNTTNAVDLEFGTNRGSAGDTLANINWKWNNTYVAQIRGMAGSDTTNKDDAHLNFYTASAGSLVERLRITSGGKFGFGTSSPDQMVHIHKGSAGSVSSTANTVLTLENSTTNILQFLNPNNTAAQVRFGDPQDDGTGFIEYSHAANTMSFGVYGPTRMQIDSNGHLGIAVASTTQLANSKQLTLRPTDDDGIRFVRPGDGNNIPNVHLDVTTTTAGSSLRSGGEAYTTKYHTYNCDMLFRSYLGGGTGGIIRFVTSNTDSGTQRYWQMDEDGMTTHRSRSTTAKTHEFSYTGGAGGGTLNENLLSISGYSASSTAVVKIEYVGMYGLANSYISQGIWLCSYRRANGGSAANALAQQTHNGGSNSSSNVTIAWVGDNLRLTVGAFTGFTVHVTATVYNATINVLV